MFSIFKKRDPVCGMKEEKGEGITKDGNWFCSAKCVQEFEKGSTSQRNKHHGCCH
ncbi:YHS domain-containing protein [Candidatus Woesearchaeota archaeon]|nr:YHS domain-containing protein [Candidatus Woesearchaeota archaeon]MBI5398676.1 YHS domain-containing protein [Candidatus Woesearchaeota archaeon]